MDETSRGLGQNPSAERFFGFWDAVRGFQQWGLRLRLGLGGCLCNDLPASGARS
jgi:hypothetical protein